MSTFQFSGSSLNNKSHKCTSVLNKKTDTVASADSPDSPVDSLKEKVVVSNKKHFNLIRNKTETAVTSMRLNKRRTKTGIFFTDLTFRMPQQTSSEVTVSS